MLRFGEFVERIQSIGGDMQNGRPEAYITGVGVVSPIGVGRDNFWNALLAGKSGMAPISLFDARDHDVRIAAECSDFKPKDFMDRKVAQRTDRFAQMGLAASKLALDDAHVWF
jgi:3-oxoacyl-[acyl-carrier-protein] synthase II